MLCLLNIPLLNLEVGFMLLKKLYVLNISLKMKINNNINNIHIELVSASMNELYKLFSFDRIF